MARLGWQSGPQLTGQLCKPVIFVNAVGDRGTIELDIGAGCIVKNAQLRLSKPSLVQLALAANNNRVRQQRELATSLYQDE